MNWLYGSSDSVNQPSQASERGVKLPNGLYADEYYYGNY